MKKRHLQLGLAGVVVVLVIAYGVWTAQNVRSLREAEAAVREVKAAGFPTRPDDLRSLPPPAAENAASLYRAAHALLKTVAAPDGAFDSLRLWPPRVADEDRALLPACEPVLALVHQAGRLPACDFQLRFEDGLTMLVPHLLQFRELSRVLAARALVRAGEGRVEEALADAGALFAMSRALRGQPFLVSQMVRCGLTESALLVLEGILPRAPSAIEALRQAEPDTLTGAVAAGLRGELVNVLSLLDPAVLAHYRAQSGIPGEFTPSRLGLPAFRTGAAACARLLSRLAAAPGDWAELARVAAVLEHEAPESGVFAPWVVSSTSTVRTLAQAETRLALARLAALFLDHRRVAGSYPESLDDLPEARDIRDPLTGKPFAMGRDGQWLVLHNVDYGSEKRRVEWHLPGG
jgi:hypothetical protein